MQKNSGTTTLGIVKHVRRAKIYALKVRVYVRLGCGAFQLLLSLRGAFTGIILVSVLFVCNAAAAQKIIA